MGQLRETTIDSLLKMRDKRLSAVHLAGQGKGILHRSSARLRPLMWLVNRMISNLVGQPSIVTAKSRQFHLFRTALFSATMGVTAHFSAFLSPAEAPTQREF